MRKKNIWTKFEESNELLQNLVIVTVCIHVILLVGLLATNFIMWKIWSVSIYLLIERIALVIVLLIYGIVCYVEYGGETF